MPQHARRNLAAVCDVATLYPLLGIDPGLTLRDHNGRPQNLLEDREGVAGLV